MYVSLVLEFRRIPFVGMILLVAGIGCARLEVGGAGASEDLGTRWSPPLPVGVGAGMGVEEEESSRGEVVAPERSSFSLVISKPGSCILAREDLGPKVSSTVAWRG